MFIDSYSGLAGAWVAGNQDTNQYVEIDMRLPYRYTAVYIQGRSDADEWVTSFKLQYYDEDSLVWQTYTDVNGSDVRNVLSPFVSIQYSGKEAVFDQATNDIRPVCQYT